MLQYIRSREVRLSIHLIKVTILRMSSGTNNRNDDFDSRRSSSDSGNTYTPLLKVIKADENFFFGKHRDDYEDDWDKVKSVNDTLVNLINKEFNANYDNGIYELDVGDESDDDVRVIPPTRQWRMIEHDEVPETEFEADSSGEEYVPMVRRQLNPSNKRTRRTRVTVSSWLSTKRRRK
jgi:hypothetical protein